MEGIKTNKELEQKWLSTTITTVSVSEVQMTVDTYIMVRETKETQRPRGEETRPVSDIPDNRIQWILRNFKPYCTFR